ncbi:MAG: peptidase, partial [Bradyrhizobium sp.]|nr:peptidase [Bradyrhizobium sp.]
MRRALLASAALLSLAMPAFGQSVDRNQVNRIIDEGTTRSQVMPIAEHLADVIGPRLTNSPQMRQAEAWTMEQFSKWGLKAVHREGFEFGRGWSIERSSVRMISPRPIQLTAIPIAWTPSTGGVISAPVIVAPIKRERDFDKWRGQLKGKIVMVTLPDTGSEPAEGAFKRYTADELGRLDQYQQPTYDPAAA